jgi:sarcosine oxidase
MGAAAGRYAHVVLGCGAIGAAAAYWLSSRTPGSVLVVEQYRVGHDRGASEDHSRIIRHAYHSTDYTSLTDAAYAAWRHVEERTGLALVTITGGLDLGVGSLGEAEIASYERALAASGHKSEPLDAAALRARFPQWQVSDEVVALYQDESGILDIRKANAAHVALARSAGVTFAPETRITRIESSQHGVECTTAAGEVITAGHLTICAGSWTAPLLETLGVTMPITLTHEQVTYWSTPNLRDFAPDRFPIWIFHGPERSWYGFPVYGEAAVKAGRDFSECYVTQETRTTEPNAEQLAELTAFMAEHLPGALGPELMTKTCVYDLPPDRHFVLDLLPGHARISCFVGAGHAAKFASLVGSILADLALDGSTPHPIDAFRADRPALTDPAFPADFRFANAARAEELA